MGTLFPHLVRSATLSGVCLVALCVFFGHFNQAMKMATRATPIAFLPQCARFFYVQVSFEEGASLFLLIII
jgi:hypothetical protein